MNKKNAEGYYDPTAHDALAAVIREEKMKQRGGGRPRKNKKKRCEYEKNKKRGY